MAIDIPTLITKLRSAPQKVGTFDRGDPKPLDEYRVVLTGEELRVVTLMAELEMHRRALADCRRETEILSRAKRITINGESLPGEDDVGQADIVIGLKAEIERLKRTSGEG